MMAFKLLRKKLNSCLGNNSYEQMTVRFLFTILNWPLILISWSYHENSKQATSLRNSHATHLFGSDGFESLDYVVNKAAEISINLECLVSFLFFVISAGFLPRGPFYFLCRFRYRRTVNKTGRFLLQVTGHRLQVTGHRSQVAGHRLQVTGHRLQVTGCRSQVTSKSKSKQWYWRCKSYPRFPRGSMDKSFTV